MFKTIVCWHCGSTKTMIYPNKEGVYCRECGVQVDNKTMTGQCSLSDLY